MEELGRKSIQENEVQEMASYQLTQFAKDRCIFLLCSMCRIEGSGALGNQICSLLSTHFALCVLHSRGWSPTSLPQPGKVRMLATLRNKNEWLPDYHAFAISEAFWPSAFRGMRNLCSLLRSAIKAQSSWLQSWWLCVNSHKFIVWDKTDGFICFTLHIATIYWALLDTFALKRLLDYLDGWFLDQELVCVKRPRAMTMNI